MARSNSVRFRINDNTKSPKLAGKTSYKSLSNPLLNDESAIEIGLEENKVAFVKNSNTSNVLEDAQNSKIENGITRTTHTTPSDNLLSVAMNSTGNNTDTRSSTTTLDVNLEMSRTYLHPTTSLVSNVTANTVVSTDNGENEPNEDLLERPLHQRDSSGSIRAAVARRKQNMTHRSAAQKREANLAVVLVSSVTMFLICHAPRIFANL